MRRAKGAALGLTQLKSEHPAIWEFIKFNVLSNISTLTRIICSTAGAGLFVNLLGLDEPFRFLIFNYTSDGSNGIGGFITFLIAEVLAQVVNYYVQMRWVFKSERGYGEAAWKYSVLAAFIVVVNLMLPGYVTDFCQDMFGFGPALSSNVASVVNTLAAVVVSFPALKFWITK